MIKPQRAQSDSKMNGKDQINENELSNINLGVAIDIHTQFGPRLLENVYKKVLAINFKT